MRVFPRNKDSLEGRHYNFDLGGKKKVSGPALGTECDEKCRLLVKGRYEKCLQRKRRRGRGDVSKRSCNWRIQGEGSLVSLTRVYKKRGNFFRLKVLAE